MWTPAGCSARPNNYPGGDHATGDFLYGVHAMRNRPGKSMWEDMDTGERVAFVFALATILIATMLPVIVFGH